MSFRQQFFIDVLEPRRMLAVSADVVSGVLRVSGAGLAHNSITVGNSADGLSVEVAIVTTTPRGAMRSVDFSFPKNLGIDAVLIRGGLLSDTLTIDSTNSAFSLPTLIIGSYGADTISAGPEDDIISGGLGADLIDAGEGNNTVHGGRGNDNISSGGGSDRISGAFGNDVINSGAGNDTVTGGAGSDDIDTGDGNDLVFGGRGADVLSGGNDNDTLWGGLGNDNISGGAGDDVIGGILGRNSLTGGIGHDVFRVRSLLLNPSNDYNSAEDILVLAGNEQPEVVV